MRDNLICCLIQVSIWQLLVSHFISTAACVCFFQDGDGLVTTAADAVQVVTEGNMQHQQQQQQPASEQSDKRNHRCCSKMLLLEWSQTDQENQEYSGNFLNLENSGNCQRILCNLGEKL